MRGKSLLLGVTLLGILTFSPGCTSLSQWWKNGAKVGPQYCRPQADVAPEWRETGSPELKTSASEDPCWWSKFNDPVLNDLIATLHRQNLTLKTAAMRVCEARAIRGIAVGNLFPQQQAIDGSYTRSGMSKNSQFGSSGFLERFTSDWSVGFGVAWELDFWGRFRRIVEAADANLEASIYTYDNAMVLLQAELAATYIQHRTLGERIRLARHNVEIQTKTVAIVQERLDAGFVSELDLRQAKAQLYTTESIIPSLEAAYRKTENRICVLLGMPPVDMSPTLNVATTIPMPPPEIAIGIPAELLMRRPDVLAAERQLASLSAQIGVAEADLYPHISIAGQIGFESQEFNDLFNWDSTASKIVPGFHWDVLNYGRLLNKICVEDARFQQALWEYRNTVLLANEEAENSLTEYLREQVRLRKLAESVSETEKANELAMLQYTEGVTDFQRVLDSQGGLVLRQDQLAESRGQVAIYLVMVYKALGGGWQCPCPGNPIAATGEVQPGGELIPTPPMPVPAPEVPGVTPENPVPGNHVPESVPNEMVPSTLPQEGSTFSVPQPQSMNPSILSPQSNYPSAPTTPQPVTPYPNPIASPILSVRPVTVALPITPEYGQVTPIPFESSDVSSVVPTSHLSPATINSTVRLPGLP